MNENHQYETFVKSFDDLIASVKRIESAISGDVAMGHKGMVDRIAALEAEVVVIKSERANEAAEKRGAKWVFATVVSVAGAQGGGVSWIATHLNTGPRP